jgi:hypothetical protein
LTSSAVIVDLPTVSPLFPVVNADRTRETYRKRRRAGREFCLCRLDHSPRETGEVMKLMCALSLAMRILIGSFLVGLTMGYVLGFRAAAPDIPEPVPVTVTTTPATGIVVESMNLHRAPPVP